MPLVLVKYSKKVGSSNFWSRLILNALTMYEATKSNTSTVYVNRMTPLPGEHLSKQMHI